MGLLKLSLDARESKLDQASGQVLVHEFSAPMDLPPIDYSAMDGYAICVNDTDLNTVYDVIDTVHAGMVAKPLPSGKVARVFTGAMIPSGADAVIPQEQVSKVDGRVQLNVLPGIGENIRYRGSDCERGTLLLAAGRQLRPPDIALLAAQGRASVSVRRPLRVGLLSIGRELKAPGLKLGAGMRYDANGPALGTLLDRRGIELIDAGTVNDDREQLQDALATLVTDGADCIISSGGVSVGERDYTRGVIEDMGELYLWGLSLKPGKPFAFGRIMDCPMFALPGNPASVLIGFCMLLYPCLLHMRGCTDPSPETLISRTFGFRSGFDCAVDQRERILCAQVERVEGGAYLAHANPAQHSGGLSIFTRCNALLRIPAGTALHAGETVQGWWLREFYDSN
jgi:molybdopterin molybdotransferase